VSGGAGDGAFGGGPGAAGGAELPGQAGPPDDAPPSGVSSTGVDGTEKKGIDLARAALMQARAQARNKHEKQQERRDGRRGLRRSGSGPDDRDPQPLRRVMGRMIAERGWQTPAAVHGVMGRWSDIVGPGIAAHCVPEKFEEGRLVVRTDSDNYATHVRWLAPKLLARINQELGDGTVTYIEVRGPAGESRRGRWSAGS
jgi:predicted nucleic acid-binding Zn ribbon protein